MGLLDGMQYMLCKYRTLLNENNFGIDKVNNNKTNVSKIQPLKISEKGCGR